MNKILGYMLIIALGIFICWLSFGWNGNEYLYLGVPPFEEYIHEKIAKDNTDIHFGNPNDSDGAVIYFATSDTVYFEWDSSDLEIVRSGKVKEIVYSNASGGKTWAMDVYVEKMSDGSYTTETEWEGIWEDIQPEELYSIDWYEEPVEIKGGDTK